ncbi:hypothetical protein EJ02DRAFT_458848 [Clathrospora elynae]|uniref:DUF7924 domain-containing protein n=1 Tax=Clathrospora elynae TaxID=706981 RepID=A0A6A5SFM6_9PLEO|nr:hypothetical protein EJ02DRAFT_458848 [Clathrospora elynae]
MKCQLSPPDTASLCRSYVLSSPPHKRHCTCRSGNSPLAPDPDSIDGQQQQQQQQRIWTARVQSILDWANNVQRSENMSEKGQSQRRANKASVRARSASPTKKSPEYRQNCMARAHIYIDQVFELPADIAALRCHIIGDAYQGNRTELEDRVGEIANDYLSQCRELARDAKGEAEWKSALLEGVLRRLVKLLGLDTLTMSASDKPWRKELKPRPPSLQDLLSSSTPRLSPATLLLATAPACLNLANPTPATDPSESTTTASEITAISTAEEFDSSNPLMTPKPDIIVGLARHSFTEVHQVLLGEWQDNGQLLSEPHLVQLGMHFPFLLVEAKGLTTSGNMMGAENQAAVGGACAINILEALQRLEPTVPLARIVFSITTEGPLHQLFIHHHIDGKYHMTVHRAWRATLKRDCSEFVLALAHIVQWGAGEYRDTVVASLDRVVERLL